MSEYDRKKDEAVKALEFINPTQPFGTKLFDSIARVSITVAIETVPIRRCSDGKLEIFLRRRKMDDTAYPGEWHTPGSAMRPGETVQDVLTRLQGEFGTGVKVFDFVGNLNNHDEERGHFFTPVYLVELDGEGRQDETHGWYPVNNVPQPVVEHHKNLLFPMAIEAFKAREKGG
jgi:ADP-ribose pyrophosphatase YjhB (NUDIX family)